MPQHELKCSECGTVIGTIEESSALERIARAAYGVYTPSPTTNKLDFKHRPWPQLSPRHKTRWKGYVQAVLVALESEGLNVLKKLTELQVAQRSALPKERPALESGDTHEANQLCGHGSQTRL